jgi:cyclase
MKRRTLLAVVMATGTLSIAVAGYQQPPAPAATGPKVIDIEKVKDTLYVLTSSTPGNPATFSGGNVAVFITDGGVTLVDDKLAGWGQAVLDKVKSVTDKPITRIINTHTHGDHTGNNGFFGANVEIVAHESTKANMQKMPAFAGDNAKFLPAKTYQDKLSLGSGKDRIDLYISTTSARDTPAATPSSSFRRCACCTPATCGRGKTVRSATGTTAAAASISRAPCRR